MGITKPTHPTTPAKLTEAETSREAAISSRIFSRGGFRPAMCASSSPSENVHVPPEPVDSQVTHRKQRDQPIDLRFRHRSEAAHQPEDDGGQGILRIGDIFDGRDKRDKHRRSNHAGQDRRQRILPAFQAANAKHQQQTHHAEKKRQQGTQGKGKLNKMPSAAPKAEAEDVPSTSGLANEFFSTA